jgi:hypothetical protein
VLLSLPRPLLRLGLLRDAGLSLLLLLLSWLLLLLLTAWRLLLPAARRLQLPLLLLRGAWQCLLDFRRLPEQSC